MGVFVKVIYTGEQTPATLNKSIFLMGPSLRPGQENELESWRNDALDILRDKGYDGVVFCPENKNGHFNEDFDYEAQIEWEEKHLNISDCIVCWCPRDLSPGKNGQAKLPAFTTNVEFGYWGSSGKMIFGAPPNADKIDYLKYYADKYNIPSAQTLIETLDNALEMLGEGVERKDGERFIPLYIWKLPSFQSWYQSQIKAGNRLEEAKLLFNFRPSYKDFIFLWILHAKVYIASEDRLKDNEFVLSRPDISSVCLYHKSNARLDDTKVILVKEFRTPTSTPDGFIRELPSGSSHHPDSAAETAAEEVFEETGFYIEPNRLKKHLSRQLAGTLSAHQAHLYSVELNDQELEWFCSQKDLVHGNQDESERTFIEVYSIEELLNNPLTDWTTLGMLMEVVFS